MDLRIASNVFSVGDRVRVNDVGSFLGTVTDVTSWIWVRLDGATGDLRYDLRQVTKL
jgi:hypothetical protein